MRTEPPAARLQRRLHPTDDADDAASDDDSGDTTGADLSRWLPADPGGQNAGLWARLRADPGRAGTVALGGLAALAVLVTIFLLVRDQPAPVVAAKLPPVQPVGSSAPGSGGQPAPAAPPAPVSTAPVVVSVVGLVHKPGLVTLEPGARIADAITAAGGTLDGADTIGLNMARRVADGEQIIVGIAPPPGQPPVLGSSIAADPHATTPDPSSAAPAGGAPAGAPIDVNAATVDQLDELPGVGPVTAQAIVAWRAEHGRFTSVDQLGEVDGIGPARLEKLRKLVRV
ncbi:ComEA family DNA-binding protein [Mycobacterium sp. MYCO198283]|uniref:ComEA family DNA-binding protein n=1 Tax=Mycobacterium sp. MYCO198283 TaxID=2883505 RepID=UPI001E4E0B40|nr:ComEA family DNA-binding protein [Mycobacterium sp. MYCO198283]MCG5432502.1 ComEA family DNA-binding protein [Mycobacterium sp. MYCO198283]